MACVRSIDTVPASPMPGAIHIEEPRALAFLGTDGDDDQCEGWYLDTGATSHMTGGAGAFSSMDRTMHGTVRFGDGSLVQIAGRGTVTFTGKFGDQIKLGGVLLIPRLKNTIVSLGQLDEKGCKVEINDNVLRIWYRRQHCW